MSLPLRIEPTDIVPLGRPGLSEPDFIFWPKNRSPVPYYGVIELKKPSSKIVTVVRSNVSTLSREAETAIQQATRYSDDITRFASVLGGAKPLFLGNRAYMFVVMGMSHEISKKLTTDTFREVIGKRLPPNLQLIPYDVLLHMFESALPPQLYLLVPDSIASIGQVDRPVIQTKLYVGQLSYSTTSDELQDAFAMAGTVVSVAIVTDKMTGRSRGFGFVEMTSSDAEAAIEMWNGQDFGGRKLIVNRARPMEGRPPRHGTGTW